MEYDDIRQKIREYNWDDGLSFPKEILENPNCDLALALEIFYLADGYSYLDNSYGITGLTEWKAFISNLFNNILNGMFSKTGNSFEIPLTKVAKYKFRKNQIPEVFLTDL